VWRGCPWGHLATPGSPSVLPSHPGNGCPKGLQNRVQCARARPGEGGWEGGQPWTGFHSWLPGLPWELPYHQHPDGRLRARHGIDALLSDKGVRPLLVQHQPRPSRGCQEGDIVFLIDVQDQLQTCGKVGQGPLNPLPEAEGSPSTPLFKLPPAKGSHGACQGS
jgi:hypothetical protein